MHRLTSSLKRFDPAQYTRLDNTEPKDQEAWKARLAAVPLHDRSPFEQLISDYLTEDKKPDLSLLVCECMKHGNVDVLAYILANEEIKSLCIEGRFSERGWKTLVKAMPDPFHVTELTLSKECFDVSKCRLLFKVLRQMPALEKVSLAKLTEERGILFDQLECPDLPNLEELHVLAKSDPKAGGGRLPLKILGACEVRRLSIEESGAISIDKHSKLASLLRGQTRTESLRLRIEHDTPKQFECYMSLLCGKTPTPLVELDLSGCRIGIPNFNKLIQALSQNQPALESLFLSRCSLSGNPGAGSINLLPLAEMKSLTHLDLSMNLLEARGTLALLKTLREKSIPLVRLNLNGNWIDNNTISAIASLLLKSETLRSLSFEPCPLQGDLGGSVEMLELVEAVKHNKSLLELQFHWAPELAEYRASVDACLDRNRKQAFMDAAMRTAAAFVMPRLLMGPGDQEEFLGRRQLPQEFIQHIIGQGLTEHDALTLSSLNKQTRAAHEEFLRKTGS